MELVVPADPEPITLDKNRTALIVVDMQNSFCKKGGMMDYWGKLNQTMSESVIETDRKIIEACRSNGIGIVYLQMTYGLDSDSGLGPESPFYWKEKGLAAERRNPELAGKFLVEGTWDWDVIDELKPHAGDMTVKKSRYSGFVRTELDDTLKKGNIKYLVFIGLFTNVCVESTLRDAFFHDYFPLLVSDACGNIGPDYIQDATVWNVQSIFGWVTTTDDLIKSLK